MPHAKLSVAPELLVSLLECLTDGESPRAFKVEDGLPQGVEVVDIAKTDQGDIELTLSHESFKEGQQLKPILSVERSSSAAGVLSQMEAKYQEYLSKRQIHHDLSIQKPEDREGHLKLAYEYDNRAAELSIWIEAAKRQPSEISGAESIEAMVAELEEQYAECVDMRQTCIDELSDDALAATWHEKSVDLRALINQAKLLQSKQYQKGGSAPYGALNQ